MPLLSSLSSRSLTGIGIGGRTVPTSTPTNTVLADYNPTADVWVATSLTGSASSYSAWNGSSWDTKSYPQLYIRNPDDFRYYNGFYYVFVRTNSSVFTRDLYRSSDLNSWTLVLATGLSSNWEIHYNPSNGNFVVVGGGSTTTAFTSTNGSTWTSVSLPANASNLRSIGESAWVGNSIVATNYGSSTDPIYRSADNGANWTSVATNWATDSYAGRSFTQDMAYGNGIYVAFVGQGYNATSVSGNGITWSVPVTRSNVPAFGNLIYFSSIKNKFIMTSLTTNDLGVSDDGVNWTLVSTSSVVQRILEAKGRIYGYTGANTTISDITDVIPNTLSAPALGAEYFGGYYMGLVYVGAATYRLVVAPASTEVELRLKTTATADSGNASEQDGFANTEAINDANHPAVQYVRSLTSGGFTDWYLPAYNEYVFVINPNHSNLPVAQRFSNRFYWGSYSGTSDGDQGRIFNPTVPSAGNTTKNNTGIWVRAVRRIPV